MSKLTNFYAHKASLQEEGKPIDPQWEQLENQLLQEEVLPELAEQLRAVLSKVKSPLMFSGSYAPNGCLSISFTRCCMQVSTLQARQETVSGAIVTEESEPLSVAEDESLSDTDTTPAEPRITKAKSVGFSVIFRDGTTYHEKKAVDTWILALKKIGLENICNNRSRHAAWHRVNGQDICIVERTETTRDSDNKSPQTLVDGFYVMTQLSNTQKEKDLLALGEYMPKLGIKVVWDDDVSAPTDTPAKTPVIDEDAARWDYPIKEQFRSFMSRQKAEGTANSYTSTLDNAVRQWINKEVDAHANSVFSYTSSEDVRLCIDMLNASPGYLTENDRKHHSMSAALNQYLLFIEDWEKRFKE